MDTDDIQWELKSNQGDEEMEIEMEVEQTSSWERELNKLPMEGT